MSEIEFKKISRYDVNIRHTANGGCIVQIGCCEASFTTPGEMIRALEEFYKDPDAMEKKYNHAVKKLGPQYEEVNASARPILEARPGPTPTPGNVLQRHHANDAIEECEPGCECQDDIDRME